MASTGNRDDYHRYKAEALTRYAREKLADAGLGVERSRVVADTLVEGDLMGHYTHGIRLLVPYVEQLNEGKMRAEGEPEVIRDTGSTLTWDGRYLAGPWLTHRAIDTAMERIGDHPVMTIVIGRSHHIGCLAAYPARATQEGLMMLLSCSDPKNSTVAPYGGVSGVYSPNPIAGGIPTAGDPVIFDVSMSATAVGTVMDARDKGEQLPHAWLQNPDGKVTRDPSAFFADPPATILPLGGRDTGYKGFALGLMVEALTNGLGGFGRRREPEQWGASVFLQVIDSAAFGGRASFEEEAAWLAQACLQSPDAGDREVRLPGSRALRLKKEQLKYGVRLEKRVVHDVQSALGGTFPDPLPDR